MKGVLIRVFFNTGNSVEVWCDEWDWEAKSDIDGGQYLVMRTLDGETIAQFRESAIAGFQDITEKR